MKRKLRAKGSFDEVAFRLRTLTKSGSSRYLSIGHILPANWQHVKVFVTEQTGEVCVLRLELIK